MSSSEPHHNELAASFARKMLPLALLFGVIIALGPPLLVASLSWQRAKTRASVHAETIAAALSKDALGDPYMWRWRAPKVIARSINEHGITEIYAVTLTRCHDEEVLHEEHLDSRPLAPMASGTAPVRDLHAQLATLELELDTTDTLHRALLVLIVSTLLGLLSGAALFWLPLRVVRRQSRALLDAREQLTAANTTLQQRVEHAVGEVRELSSRLVFSQDEERARIARELHDGIAQQLSALRLDLERAATLKDPSSAIATTIARSEATLVDLRHTIHDLRPVALEHDGLVDVLNASAERFEIATGIAVYFKHQGAIDALPPAMSASILRVYQEALQNVSRHAEASEIGVSLTADDGLVSLEVRDDGIGFDTNSKSRGHGLANMRTRAKLFGGSLELTSAPDEGTTLRFAIPIRTTPLEP